MEVGELNNVNKLRLCRRVIRDCGRWLRRILQESEPADKPLREFLSNLALGLERSVDFIDEVELEEAPGPERGMGDKAFDPLLKRFFPSMGQGLGEGFLGRETGMHLAECLEEELRHFYQSLAEVTDDPKARGFFLQAGKEEESHLDIVRHTILK
jgi:hypothetical protein